MNEEGIDSINAALKLQFTKEVDLQHFKQDVMKNIDQATFDLEYGKADQQLFDFNFESWTHESVEKKSIYLENFLKKSEQGKLKLNHRK